MYGLLGFVCLACFVLANADASVRAPCFGSADRQLVNQRLGTKTPYRFLTDRLGGAEDSEQYEGIRSAIDLIFCIYLFNINQ